MNYDYDITMCRNEYCAKREQCRRFLTYRQYKQDTDENQLTFVSMLLQDTDGALGNDCKRFWAINK